MNKTNKLTHLLHFLSTLLKLKQIQATRTIYPNYKTIEDKYLMDGTVFGLMYFPTPEWKATSGCCGFFTRGVSPSAAFFFASSALSAAN